MRWIIAVDQKRNAQTVAWCQTFAKGYDCSSVEWIRLDTGRHLPGRRPPQGVYGRCYYPSRDRRTFRVSCQVPGPFPHRLISKRQPLYEGRDPAWLSIPRGWESNGVGEAVRIMTGAPLPDGPTGTHAGIPEILPKSGPATDRPATPVDPARPRRPARGGCRSSRGARRSCRPTARGCPPRKHGPSPPALIQAVLDSRAHGRVNRRSSRRSSEGEPTATAREAAFGWPA